MTTNGNDSANPQIQSEYGGEYDHGVEKPFTNTYSYGGLTKREVMAMAALPIVSGAYNVHSEKMQMMTKAVEYADALIDALNYNKR